METPSSEPTPKPSAQDIKPVFFDPTRRRAAGAQWTLIALSVLTAVVVFIFCVSVLAVPVAGRVRLPLAFVKDRDLRILSALNGRQTTKRAPVSPPDTRRDRRVARQQEARVVRHPGSIPGRADGVVGGFYVSWDASSLASLKQHAAQMTHLFPGWLHLNEDGSTLVAKDGDPTDAEALQVARQNHLVIVPLLNNFSDGLQDFDNDRLHDLLISPPKRARLIAQVRDYLVRHHYSGINIDLETDEDADRALLPVLVSEFSAALHPSGLLVTADTQTGSPEQAAAIARWCDFVIPMIYDLHDATGGLAGPIAPDGWARNELNAFLNAVPASKTVLAIGNYAYNWIENQSGAESQNFDAAMATASESFDGDDGVVHFDPQSRNPYYVYTEDDGKRHIVWYLDAITAYNSLRYAESRGVRGRALWYVGSEDPTLWTFFARGKTTAMPPDLDTVRYGFDIDFEGEGEIMDILGRPGQGQRTVAFAPDGTINDETFSRYPTAYIVRRTGQHRDRLGKLEKKIALTFDDGPDPLWTPQVLDVLHAASVPATFFVIGVNAQSRPDLLRREWSDGDEIGNHTFYHPNMANVAEARMRLEIDATQRTIESAIGRSTPLFRPPFSIDVQPSTSDELKPVDVAQSMGYVTVAEGIDPRDWEMTTPRRTPEQIASSVVEGAEHGDGNIVLLHDGGGDRDATVRALPLIIARLKAKGYRFVTVTDLMGSKPRDAYFPPVQGRQRLLALVDREVFGVSSLTGRILVGLFLFTLIAGTLRTIGIGTLAVLHARRERVDLPHPEGVYPSVSVLIAAFNEERVIVQTVRALLDGSYPRLEVIVIDDGSQDDTSGVVQRAFGTNEQVHVFRLPNGGKATALNFGIAHASGEILIGLDADTLFAPDTVHRLARHFVDPSVGAVAGNVQVGNRTNLVTRWQSVEYVTSQNFDRRAYDLLNAIPVIPGAVSAWRASAVSAVGGYSTDTLAEDADLTWRIRRDGWKLRTDSTALGFTEAPERLRDLAKQRFRWTFGTLQTLWKHRDLLFRPDQGAFGCLVVPSLWVFQIILPLALPFADLGLLFAALMGNVSAAAAYCSFFFVVEFGAACLAFQLDPATSGKRGDVFYLFLQRFVYRYLLFSVLFRALTTAVHGSRAGWNKIERRGTAQVRSPR